MSWRLLLHSCLPNFHLKLACHGQPPRHCSGAAELGSLGFLHLLTWSRASSVVRAPWSVLSPRTRLGVPLTALVRNIRPQVRESVVRVLSLIPPSPRARRFGLLLLLPPSTRRRFLSPLSSMFVRQPHSLSPVVHVLFSVHPAKPNNALQLTSPQCHGSCLGSHRATAPAQLSSGR